MPGKEILVGGVVIYVVLITTEESLGGIYGGLLDCKSSMTDK